MGYFFVLVIESGLTIKNPKANGQRPPHILKFSGVASQRTKYSVWKTVPSSRLHSVLFHSLRYATIVPRHFISPPSSHRLSTAPWATPLNFKTPTHSPQPLIFLGHSGVCYWSTRFKKSKSGVAYFVSFSTKQPFSPCTGKAAATHQKSKRLRHKATAHFEVQGSGRPTHRIQRLEHCEPPTQPTLPQPSTRPNAAPLNFKIPHARQEPGWHNLFRFLLDFWPTQKTGA